MSKVSKTARASMAQTVGEKAVISDEVYIKNLRNDVASGCYVAQEGAKALLRAYDKLIGQYEAAVNDADQAIKQRDAALSQNETLKEELAVAGAENETLKTEIAAAQGEE